MLTRYSKDSEGKPVRKALVYEEREHRIDSRDIDPDAFRIVERLRASGHDAYIVGGAVRDLLLGRHPKDFDIVTDAQPPRIRRIFHNSRVIGRRFRLVHVYAGPHIYEVSTFRSIKDGTVGNTYGTIDEDALRRDFTMNALYYDPIGQLLVDYVGGFKDVMAKRIKPVIPLATIFREDPVRMFRAVKYSATTGCRIPLALAMAMRRDARLLSEASSSRLSEELAKVLGSGRAASIFEGLARFKLLPRFMPALAARCDSEPAFKASFGKALAELDETVNETRDKTLSRLLSYVVRADVEAVCSPPVHSDPNESWRAAVAAARALLEPLVMPRVELEAAVRLVYKAPESAPHQKRKRSRRRRKSGRSADEGQAADTAVEAASRASAPKPADEGRGSAPGKVRASRPTPFDEDAAAPDRSGGTAAKRRRRRRRTPRSPGAEGTKTDQA
ncbi:MAG: polynucleotide adenylyltransferase PcnB [Spirochaetales bacterium]|nr:polynucleotide adenylyltransferase PcnB [Spirochaetales bacterium]